MLQQLLTMEMVALQVVLLDGNMCNNAAQLAKQVIWFCCSITWSLNTLLTCQSAYNDMTHFRPISLYTVYSLTTSPALNQPDKSLKWHCLPLLFRVWHSWISLYSTHSSSSPSSQVHPNNTNHSHWENTTTSHGERCWGNISMDNVYRIYLVIITSNVDYHIYLPISHSMTPTPSTLCHLFAIQTCQSVTWESHEYELC